jgi:hypothetical protein
MQYSRHRPAGAPMRVEQVFDYVLRLPEHGAIRVMPARMPCLSALHEYVP